MKLTRPLCFLDIESATRKDRPDPAVDKIVKLAIVKLVTITSKERLELAFNPGLEMSAANVAIHGITNEEVKNYPLMTLVHAKQIQEFISGCDLAGFNCTGYDNPLLFEECYRVGIELDFTGVHVVDAGNIYKKKEERTLGAAVKFYCGEDHGEAHSAIGDVIATIKVLQGQIVRYPDLAEMDVPELAAFSTHEPKRVDLFGTIVLNKEGVPCFGTKRNQGVPIKDDTGYAEWFLRNDFPANTKMHLRKILDAIYNPESTGQLL